MATHSNVSVRVHHVRVSSTEEDTSSAAAPPYEDATDHKSRASPPPRTSSRGKARKHRRLVTFKPTLGRTDERTASQSSLGSRLRSFSKFDTRSGVDVPAGMSPRCSSLEWERSPSSQATSSLSSSAPKEATSPGARSRPQLPRPKMPKVLSGRPKALLPALTRAKVTARAKAKSDLVASRHARALEQLMNASHPDAASALVVAHRSSRRIQRATKSKDHGAARKLKKALLDPKLAPAIIEQLRSMQRQQSPANPVAPTAISTAAGAVAAQATGSSSPSLGPSAKSQAAITVAAPQMIDAVGNLTGMVLRSTEADKGVKPPLDRMSLFIHWWGYEMTLPPATMSYLSTARSVSGAFISFLSSMVVAGGAPELLPFVNYLSMAVDVEFKAIQAADRGKGVVLAATWIMPLALVPRAWDLDLKGEAGHSK
ncbi:unnamed protein product [Jaminaea pallidilutea]